MSPIQPASKRDRAPSYVRPLSRWTRVAGFGGLAVVALVMINNFLATVPKPDVGPEFVPHSAATLHPDVRTAAEAARAAKEQADEAATRAGATAAEAKAVDPASAASSGLAVRSIAKGDRAGDSYAGEWRAGAASGAGVDTYAQNAANPLGTARYEGEHDKGKRSGVGVLIWGDGQRYSGGYGADKYNGAGVLEWPDGRRYEGEFADGDRSGFGVLWDGQGRIMSAGKWADDILAAPLALEPAK